MNREAFQFFHREAGYIVGRRALGAFKLAKAEERAQLCGWSVRWEEDCDADLSWLRPGETVAEVLGAVLVDPQGEVLASLWGICDPSPSYRRVVAAELALEAFGSLRAELDRAAVNSRKARLAA